MTLKNYYNVNTREEGMNALMRSVYMWMMVGLLVSGVTAYAAAHSEILMNMIYGNPYMIWVLFIIEIGLVIAISAGINKMSVDTARMLFILFSFIDGLTLSSIFLIYTSASIAETFFIASAMFGVMSLYGYFTDTDLTSWGKLLFMALIGLIIAMIVNFFLKSSPMEWWISVIGVVVFTGLTAYDTQKIKQMGDEIEAEGETNISKIAVIGALELYLDLINLFLMLLEFFGAQKR
jgi:FtsH-binding integral membrane protein